MTELDPARTALVLIDLQNGITALPTSPRSGADIVARTLPFVEKCRAAGVLVVPVHVGWHADFGDALRQQVDAPGNHGTLPDDWLDFVEGLVQPGDVTIIKRQWSAFHGTELDLQLRRRGITNIVLCGIATNIGVESTARQAWEHGYQLVLAEDLCTSLGDGAHEFAIKTIFPRLGLVRQSAEISFKA
ncbi:hydrolase [Acidocella facilis]|uniref:hydrolase n=1 Tax=Acidocella facilis TaxID=525 RepID=UPI001F3630AD|nr:hydrolase [Acidocella facilis]